MRQVLALLGGGLLLGEHGQVPQAHDRQRPRTVAELDQALPVVLLVRVGVHRQDNLVTTYRNLTVTPQRVENVEDEAGVFAEAVEIPHHVEGAAVLLDEGLPPAHLLLRTALTAVQGPGETPGEDRHHVPGDEQEDAPVDGFGLEHSAQVGVHGHEERDDEGPNDPPAAGLEQPPGKEE